MSAAAADTALLVLMGIAAAAWAWHAVHEHHAHLRLLRVVRPDTFVPPVRHDTGWHGLGHWKRMAVHAAMLGAAVVIGLAWQLSWIGTAIALVLGGTAWAVLAFVRAAGSLRHREARTEPPATERKAA